MTSTAMGDGLDIDFYRSFHPDLSGFDDEFLVTHYRNHGIAEERHGNLASYLLDLAAQGRPIPADFDVDEYLRVHPDVAVSVSSKWEAYRHYAFHGAAEGRGYHGFDLDFYAKLYCGGGAISLTEALRHHRGAEAPVTAFRSLEEMLVFHNVPSGRWLDLFDARDFKTMNYRHITPDASREQCIEMFLRAGIDSLMTFNVDWGFDPDFYREISGCTGPIADCYLHWLTYGLDAGTHATPAEWLRAEGLELAAFPTAFAWRLYIGARQSGAETLLPWTRWSALRALAEDRTTPAPHLPIGSQGGGALLEALAKRHLSRGDLPLALACAERAAQMTGATIRHQLVLGDCYYGAHRWLAASNCYRRFHDLHEPTCWSSCRLADGLANLGRFDEATGTLLAGKAAFAGEPAWREMAASVVQRWFDRRSDSIKSHFLQGDRSLGNAESAALVEEMEALILDLTDLPARRDDTAGRSAQGGGSAPRVIMLANCALPQCTFYRVDQKRDFFGDMDADLTVYAEGEVDDFIGAIPFADVAIFYRVIAAPSNLRALMAARSAGIRTMYEIDDLIFDPDLCPEDFDSFEGQITRQAHADLMYAVSLFRAMIERCDLAIASTEALAKHMGAIVAGGQAFVVRNGLHHRTLGLDRREIALRPAGRSTRIFYGSGTLSHNRDFNSLVGATLCALMARDPSVVLVIAGHLKLAPMFERFASRIERLPHTSSLDVYWSVLAGCDINLAVLAPGPVSDCKSEIKWLEAAVFEIPSIVSATATYAQVVKDGVTGFLAGNSDEWGDRLARLVADPGLRAAMGRAARAQAIERYRPDVQASAMRAALSAAARPRAAATARRARLLLVNVFFPPQAIGGATRVVANNVDDWLDRHMLDGVDVAIAAADYDGAPAYRKRNGGYRGLPVFRIAPPVEPDIDWKPFDPRMAAWFDEVLDSFAPDLVHFHCVQRLTASTVEACWRRNTPYFITAHDGWWLSDFQFLFDDERRMRIPGDELRLGSAHGLDLDASLGRQARLRPVLRRALAVLAPSESFARLYQAAGIDNARGLANGLPPMTFKPHLPSRTGRVRLGHVGNTRSHKGFDLIEAALKANDFGNLELLALDHGHTGAQPIEDRWGATLVRRAGFVAQDRMNEIYAQLDVLLAPSAWTESFGLVTREAHAAGLWVVAGNRGAIGADVRENADGFVVDVSSPRGVERALATINAAPRRFLKPVRPRHLRPAAEQAAELAALYRLFLPAV